MSIGSKIKKEVRRHPRLYALGAGGLALSAALALSVGPSLGAFTASVSAGVAQQAGTLTEELTGAACSDTTADAADSFAATCGTNEVAEYATPGSGGSMTITAQDTGTITPLTDSSFDFTLTPGSCTGSNSTICADTWVSIEVEGYDSGWVPDGCIYGGTATSAGACPALSDTYTLATLADAGTITLPIVPSNGTFQTDGEEFVITTELSPSAPSSDEGATASEPLSWTMSA